MSQTTAVQKSEQPEASRGIEGLLSEDNIKARFHEVLGPRRGAQYISSILTTVNASDALRKCDPLTVIAAGAQAAALDLSIVPTIGQAAMVPYGGKAQFQIMTRGIIQLAHRTNKYRRIHLAEVFDGQLVKHDEFTGKVTLDADARKSDKVEGFYFTFELLNGFMHEAYWSARRCIEHGWKYSKSFRKGKGLWMEDTLIPKKNWVFDRAAFKGFVTLRSGAASMCGKTAVKNELNKWGPLSADMQDAFTADQAVLRLDGSKKYIDSTAEPTMDEEVPNPKPAKAKDGNGKSVPKKEDASPHEAEGIVDRVTMTEIDGKAGHYVYLKGGERYIAWEKKVAQLAKDRKGKKVKIAFDATDVGREIQLLEPA